MVAWLNHVTINTGGAGTHTIDPANPTAGGATVVDGSAFTPTAGRFLICVAAAPTTSSTPTGWTLGSGAAANGSMNVYVFHKVAAGGDTLVTNHASGFNGVTFDVYEFPAAAAFGSAAGYTGTASGATETISGLSGTTYVMAFVLSAPNGSGWTIAGATEHFDYNGGGNAGRYAASSTFTTGSSVGVTATLATHDQLHYAITGLSNATAAGGTGSLALSGSAGAAGPGTATGSLTLTGQAASGLPASGTAALTLSATATSVPAATAGGALTLTASVAVTAPGSATGSIELTGVAEAVPLYGTDTSNAFTGLSIRATALVYVTQAVAEPPFSLGPQRFEKAIAFPEPTLVKGRPTFVNNVVAKLAPKDQVLVNGKDITWFRADAPGDTPILVPGYELIEPFGYGASDNLIIKRTNSLFERYGAGELSWLFQGARVQYRQIDEDGQVTDYRGIVMAVRPSRREWVAQISGEVSGRAELILMQHPLVRKLFDLGDMLKFEVRGLGLHLVPAVGPHTGIKYPQFGGMSLQSYIQRLGQLSRTRTTQARALMPKVWGGLTWDFAPKDVETVDFTMYPDGYRIDISGLVDDLTEQPNTVFGNGVTPDGVHWANTKYPGYFQGNPEPYPFNDHSHTFGIGTSDADTDTGTGITTLAFKLAWMNYLPDALEHLTTYTSDIADAVDKLKEDAGLPQNGTMTYAAWNALWDTDVVGYNPQGARIFQIAQDKHVNGFLYSANGGIIGRNPDWIPGTIRVDVEYDYGIATKSAAIAHARTVIRMASGHQWTGDIVLDDIAVFAGDHDAADAASLTPDDMLSARKIRPGMNGKIVYFDGSSVLLHVAGVKVSAPDIYGARTVTLTADTGARDVYDLGEILEREQESRRSPYREWLAANRPNRPVRNQVQRDEWFGRYPENVPLRGGHWNVIPVIMGQSGTVNQTYLRLTEETEFGYAVFSKEMFGSSMDGHIGNPLEEDIDGRTVWEQDSMQDYFEDQLLLTVQGQGKQPCGYGWRHGYDENGDRTANPLTGTVIDRQSWSYVTLSGKLPVVWLAIWPRDDCAIKRGQWFSALQDDLT